MRLRTVPRAVVASLLSVYLFALPVSAEETQIRDLSGFDVIEVGGFVDLTITQGSDYFVEVRGPGESLENLVTEVSGGTLRISQQPKEKRWFRFDLYDDFSVSVTLPELRALHAGGGSDVRTEGSIAAERLEVASSGGSDVWLDVEVTQLQVRTSGGSDTVLTGRADRLDAQSSGGSDLGAGRLEVLEADVRSSGGSDIVLDVTQRLTARASGGSDIHYSGDPQVVDADSSGGADVQRR